MNLIKTEEDFYTETKILLKKQKLPKWKKKDISYIVESIFQDVSSLKNYVCVYTIEKLCIFYITVYMYNSKIYNVHIYTHKHYILKFIQKCQESGVHTMILKKRSKIGELTLSDIMRYCKSIIGAKKDKPS